MQSADEIEKLFLERVRPFEDQIKELNAREDENLKKIAALKEMVFSLSQILEQINAQRTPSKSALAGGAKNRKVLEKMKIVIRG
jgi:hypothetical protein